MWHRGESDTQNSGRQVHTRRPCERLVVSPGVSNHQTSWLLEGGLHLVSEGSESEAAGNRTGSSGSSELQHSPLASAPGRYGTRSSRIFKGNDGMSRRWKLLPGSLQIYDVGAIMLPFVDVLLHLEVKVGATLVGFCCKEFEDILLLHLWDIKGSRHHESFSLSYNRNPEQRPTGPLWGAQAGRLVTIVACL